MPLLKFNMNASGQMDGDAPQLTDMCAAPMPTRTRSLTSTLTLSRTLTLTLTLALTLSLSLTLPRLYMDETIAAAPLPAEQWATGHVVTLALKLTFTSNPNTPILSLGLTLC